ncbi:SDR family oxidoreductase [Streptomyces sp. NPDC005438]|uniref:SDR family NAD(P)-dependent oxidoreductase n=1 Tax=Streptomyces sp. NPDC005438 TaxID=3156880 RepID=UPI0033A9A669
MTTPPTSEGGGSPFPDTGRGVLVTGAARGLGRELALTFARNGDRVAVHHHSRPEEAAATLAALPGQGHVALRADLTEPERARALVAEAATALGGVDVLVNNAAVNLPHPPATTGFEEWVAAWRQHVDVNLLAAAHVSHQVAGRMIERGRGGRIVNVGSRGAHRGEPDHPAYGATKAALHALGQSLAVALAPYRIAVTSVAPGFFATERVAPRLEGAEGEALRAQSPFGRVGTAREVAEAVLWLASSAAEWSSGTVVDLNGASHLRS